MEKEYSMESVLKFIKRDIDKKINIDNKEFLNKNNLVIENERKRNIQFLKEKIDG